MVGITDEKAEMKFLIAFVEQEPEVGDESSDKVENEYTSSLSHD